MWQRQSFPRFTLCAVAALSCAASACIPGTFEVRHAPLVEGTLRLPNGDPVVGARLAQTLEYGDSTCSRNAVSTVTDAGGRFSFPEVVRRRRNPMLLGDAVYCYRLCGGDTGGLISESCFMHRMLQVDSVACVAPDSSGSPPKCQPIRQRRNYTPIMRLIRA
jgi:hypothetical protein